MWREAFTAIETPATRFNEAIEAIRESDDPAQRDEALSSIAKGAP